jgi:hypothetical protein
MGLIFSGGGIGFPLGAVISSRLRASTFHSIKIGAPFMSGFGLDALTQGINSNSWGHSTSIG